MEGSTATAGPRRVRVEGDLFHGRVPPGAVYVGRAAPGLPASPYANPHTVRDHGAPEASRLYLEHVASRPDVAAGIVRDLAGGTSRAGARCQLGRAGPVPRPAALLVIANQQ